MFRGAGISIGVIDRSPHQSVGRVDNIQRPVLFVGPRLSFVPLENRVVVRPTIYLVTAVGLAVVAPLLKSSRFTASAII
jgi:hypothetical protein